MRLFSKCLICKKRKLLIMRRHYIIKQVSLRVRAKDERCGSCHRKTKRMLSVNSGSQVSP